MANGSTCAPYSNPERCHVATDCVLSCSIGVPMTDRGNVLPKHVLITGGAGFLGINLTRYLLDRGVAVSTIDIADFDYPDVVANVRVISGDIRDRAAMRRALEGVDMV